MDEWIVRSISDELKDVVDRVECCKLLVDFVNVEDFSSLMLGQLLTLRKRMATKAGSVILCGLSPKVRKFFDEIMLSQLFDIRATEADALAAYGMRSPAKSLGSDNGG